MQAKKTKPKAKKPARLRPVAAVVSVSTAGAMVQPQAQSPKPPQIRHNWKAILHEYLTPTISADGASARWPSLVDVATRCGIPLQSVKERSAKEGWTAKQEEVEDRWWLKKNNAIYRQMGMKLPQVQGAAFANSMKVIEQLQASLRAPLDVATTGRAAVANARALDTAFAAAGMERVPLVPAGVLVDAPALRVTQTEETVALGADGKPTAMGRRQTLLEIFQGRQLAPTARPVEDDDAMLDDLDRPSPLAAHLSMAR